MTERAREDERGEFGGRIDGRSVLGKVGETLV